MTPRLATTRTSRATQSMPVTASASVRGSPKRKLRESAWPDVRRIASPRLAPRASRHRLPADSLSRRHVLPCLLLAAMLSGTVTATVRAADCTCTDTDRSAECVAACKATWDEKKTKKPAYEMKCEYACARDFDSWHAPPPECRCTPPCGRLYVKKRIYKTETGATPERVPQYEATTVAAPPCDCSRCRGISWWDPFGLCDWLRGR
jgi:hypothetical protein